MGELKAFNEEFTLTGLAFAYQVLQAGAGATYDGGIDATWHHDNNTRGNGCTLRVRSSGGLSWGNGWQERHQKGTIEWWTGSDHFVRFHFDEDLALSKVQIGQDESDCFYPRIREIAADGDIEVEAVENPSRPQPQI
jgi:hypothetical protein